MAGKMSATDVWRLQFVSNRNYETSCDGGYEIREKVMPRFEIEHLRNRRILNSS